VVLEEICECPRERAVLEAFCHAEFRVGSAAREFRCGDAFGLRVARAWVHDHLSATFWPSSEFRMQVELAYCLEAVDAYERKARIASQGEDAKDEEDEALLVVARDIYDKSRAAAPKILDRLLSVIHVAAAPSLCE